MASNRAVGDPRRHKEEQAAGSRNLITGGGGLLATSAATGLPLRARGTLDHADPGWVVIDEICGQCCALLLLPHPSWSGAVLAFALFRLLDITKPGPIGAIDRWHGTMGVMLDDVAAGLFGAFLLWALRLSTGWP